MHHPKICLSCFFLREKFSSLYLHNWFDFLQCQFYYLAPKKSLVSLKLFLSVLSSRLCTSTGIFTWLFRSVPYFCIFLSFIDDNISFSEKKMMYIANYFQKYALPLSRNHAPFPYFLVNFPRLFKCIHSWMRRENWKYQNYFSRDQENCFPSTELFFSERGVLVTTVPVLQA